MKLKLISAFLLSLFTIFSPLSQACVSQKESDPKWIEFKKNHTISYSKLFPSTTNKNNLVTLGFFSEEKEIKFYMNGKEIALEGSLWIENVPEQKSYLFKAVHIQKGSFEAKIDLNKDYVGEYNVNFKTKKLEYLPPMECY